MPAEREVEIRASNARLARFVDRMIPQELHADADVQLRSRVLVIASIGLGGLTLVMITVRMLTAPLDPGVLLAILVMLVMFALPLVQRVTRSHRIAGGLLVGLDLLVLPFLNMLSGVFPDASAALLPIVPLIAAFFLGPLAGFVAAALLAAAVVVLQSVLVAPTAAQMAEFWWTYVAVTAAAPLMSAVLAAAYERERARTQRRLAEVTALAEAANRGKTDFLRHVSHELRTPLNAIVGYGELVREQLRDDASPLAPDMDRLLGATDQLLGLINDMLDISRIEAGAVDLVLAEVDLRAVLEQVRDMALPLAATNHNDLVLTVPDDLPRLWTDVQRLRQILLNLVGNACKFTDRGRVGLSAEVHADHVVFRVRDTGVGMSAEQSARIFEPFVQVHASLARRRLGSGLGLTLSRQLAVRLGGDISVTSEPGRGSEFAVRLPVRPPASP